MLLRESCLTKPVLASCKELTVCRTWTNDSSLASLAISNGRLQGLDRIWSAAKSHDDWREWIYLTIMDHL